MLQQDLGHSLAFIVALSIFSLPSLFFSHYKQYLKV